MRTPRPTARPAHSTLHLGDSLLDTDIPCLCFFARDDPTDPLILRKRRDIVPQGFYLWNFHNRLPQIRG